MSTLFSIRPAPRKRPWICKASPPALAMPPYPPALLCTVSLRDITWPPTAPRWTATFILYPPGPLGPYTGSHIRVGSGITLTFHWKQGDPTGYATAAWFGLGYADSGTWETNPVKPNPYLRYDSFNVASVTFAWSSQLTITA